MRSSSRAAALALAFLLPGVEQAAAQLPQVSVEVMTDDRRRGLSWSDGDPTVSASLGWQMPGLSLDGAVTALRQSARHGAADAAIDLGAGLGTDLGLVRVMGRGAMHFFPGAKGMNYGELGGSAGLGIGPVQLDGLLLYAPPQDAIGGDNLHMRLEGSLGIPTTPFTVSAAIGRTTGSVDDPIRAARLRPGGRYVDYRLGVEYRQARWTAGLDFTDTDIGPTSLSPFADADNAGARLTGRLSWTF